MKTELVTFAETLGFSLCRIAPCVTPPHVAEFRAWLDAGRAGEMSWLARNADRRTDPQQVLPGARSVIVLAVSYAQSAGCQVPGAKWEGTRTAESLPNLDARAATLAPPGTRHLAPGTPRIARYAWGDDYHEVIEKKLASLAAWLGERGGRQRCYVDTGPVLERDFAALAGAGWHGKSTMLIHPQLGAYFFLAEILTTLEIAPDAPLPDRCGSCTRCIAACPTNAITGPRELDARRCISYLTIELKGAIPLEFREAVGDRIYGCDDCLAACPWNRFATASRETAFAAREFVHGMTLRDFLEMD